MLRVHIREIAFNHLYKHIKRKKRDFPGVPILKHFIF